MVYVFQPAETPHWPESAFKPAKRQRGRSVAGSVVGKEEEGNGLFKESKERHFTEAERFANPVLETYLLDHSYTDYRGPCFKARSAAELQARQRRVRGAPVDPACEARSSSSSPASSSPSSACPSAGSCETSPATCSCPRSFSRT